MVRQTPFCPPNAHLTQESVSGFNRTPFPVMGLFKYFSHSLSASVQCTQRGTTQHGNLTHSNRKGQMKSSGEAVKSWRAMLSRASVDSITQSPVHRPDTFTSRLRLYLVTTGKEA